MDQREPLCGIGLQGVDAVAPGRAHGFSVSAAVQSLLNVDVQIQLNVTECTCTSMYMYHTLNTSFCTGLWLQSVQSGRWKRGLSCAVRGASPLRWMCDMCRVQPPLWVSYVLQGHLSNSHPCSWPFLSCSRGRFDLAGRADPAVVASRVPAALPHPRSCCRAPPIHKKRQSVFCVELTKGKKKKGRKKGGAKQKTEN